ncbi:phage portal protein [Paenarthrobacter ureafaciens]|uniref:Phage portal protein n=1 Tax=Paenarthrobacter ureafaciens TaxID=37931 RepID=A0AAX3EE35_PAEUR|nr:MULTISPECIES: phage portal protein [Paenarthrobacter]MDO5876492.1 phage portal protein [Paenarthrobacter sp. SD-1]QMU83189.1 phage portal protein [Paenarthrobacter ureafaciens]UYV96265.1 phage portal protein [Paenarthrobacter ureafaciens]
MGILSSALELAGYNVSTGFPQTTQVTGVFSPSTLALAVFPDVDTSQFPVDAGTAMTIPAVRRGVQIISSVGSRLPLTTNGADLPWLNASVGAITPAKRTSSLIQDLIFYNDTLVEVERDSAGYVTSYQHVLHHLWSLDAKGNILVNGKTVPANQYVYIPGLMPLGGFLQDGRDSVRQYRNITQTINNRTAVPEPVVLTKETQPINATPEEIDEMREHLHAAMTSRGGNVHVPFGLDVAGFGASDSVNSLMVEAKEGLRKDLANFLGITVGLLDGSTGDSNTYNNAVDERNELLELTIKSFTEPIADRLSQDDVTPPGVKVSVDYSTFKTNVSKANTESPVIPNA